MVIAEAEVGDPIEASKRIETVKPFRVLPVTAEVEVLASQYIEKKLLPGSAFRDAVHMAVATMNNVDFLATWNCKHLAGAIARQRLQKYNLDHGLHFPIPATPEELMT